MQVVPGGGGGGGQGNIVTGRLATQEESENVLPLQSEVGGEKISSISSLKRREVKTKTKVRRVKERRG